MMEEDSMAAETRGRVVKFLMEHREELVAHGDRLVGASGRQIDSGEDLFNDLMVSALNGTGFLKAKEQLSLAYFRQSLRMRLLQHELSSINRRDRESFCETRRRTMMAVAFNSQARKDSMRLYFREFMGHLREYEEFSLVRLVEQGLVDLCPSVLASAFHELPPLFREDWTWKQVVAGLRRHLFSFRSSEGFTVYDFLPGDVRPEDFVSFNQARNKLAEAFGNRHAKRAKAEKWLYTAVRTGTLRAMGDLTGRRKGDCEGGPKDLKYDLVRVHAGDVDAWIAGQL